jgi:diacylglycerol kinase family enzyme
MNLITQNNKRITFFFFANAFFEAEREREREREKENKRKKNVARAKPPHETLT